MTAVIWIDWYAYHVARLRALTEHRPLKGEVCGIEMVGGCGVHSGLQFRAGDRGGLPIQSLMPSADWQSAGQIRLAIAAWRKLGELNPSTILVPGYYTVPAIAAAIWARLHGKRSVLMSETTKMDHQRVWWKERAKRFLVQVLFDGAIAGGKPHMRYLEELGFPKERIAKYYDVVDNEFYHARASIARQSPELRERLGLPPKYFLYVGRLAAEKNVDGLLKAFADYRKRGGSWSLVLVGDGPSRATLEHQSTVLNIREYIGFAGLKTAQEITPYFAFADCFVLASSREPWGLVVNEAMASGLPVLVSDRCGCAEDLVEAGRNGFIFDPHRPEELSAHMLAIEGARVEDLEAMGQRSREIIAGYSTQQWAEEVARIVG